MKWPEIMMKYKKVHEQLCKYIHWYFTLLKEIAYLSHNNICTFVSFVNYNISYKLGRTTRSRERKDISRFPELYILPGRFRDDLLVSWSCPKIPWGFDCDWFPVKLNELPKGFFGGPPNIFQFLMFFGAVYKLWTTYRVYH